MSCVCCSQESKTATYEPFINRFALLTKCPLDNGPRTFKCPMGGPQQRTSSSLQSLPVELYQACLQYLDLGTLTAMRRVSQYTRHAIDTLHQYKELYEHAPQALRACLSTGVAAHIPIRGLHHALTNMECHYCKTSTRCPCHEQFQQSHLDSKANLGTYLSLYGGHRTCLFCLRNNPILHPVPLKTLINLRCQRNTTLQHTPNLPLLNTIPGSYSSLPSKPIHYPRTMLFRAASIAPQPGTPMTEKEQRALFGNERTPWTYHHPFVAPNHESDIYPQANTFISPDSETEIAQLFQSAIIFPYLPPSKSLNEYGVLCTDCCLHMRYEEERWMIEQESRRRNGQATAASLRTIDRIKEARRRACMMFTVSEEARQVGVEMRKGKWGLGSGVLDADYGEGMAMSIQEHRMGHAKEKLSRAEKEWRKTVKGPPLPLLTHDRFG